MGLLKTQESFKLTHWAATITLGTCTSIVIVACNSYMLFVHIFKSVSKAQGQVCQLSLKRKCALST